MQSRLGVLAAAALVPWLGVAWLVVHAAPAAAQNARWGANYFPNVTLTTHRGETVKFYDDLIKGKIVAINLIYTSCQYACPLETARLAQVQRQLGDRMGRDVFFYSITIDPDYDTPAVLAEYAKKFEAGPGWLFLTGSKADIDLISRKTGLYSPPNPSNPDGHTPHLLVGNEVTGQWIRNSGVDDPRFLATTIGTWLNSWRTPSAPARSYADAPRLEYSAGEYAFTKHCAACHTIGGGDHIGPDLAGVTSARDRAWLTRFIASPDAVRSEGDAIARALAAKYKPAVMPRLGLAPGDVAPILSYIETRSAASHPATPIVVSAVTASLAPVIDPYVQIQRALNVGSIDGVRDRARDIATRAAAASLDRPLAIAAVRAAFGELSDAVIAYAASHRGALGDDVKVAYCPMVRKYWLQRGDTIQNPFYGRTMSDCGRFVSALPGDISR